MFFEDDICFCGNAKDCPKREKCRRGNSKPGIHSYSDFYDKNKEYEYFMGRE